MENRFDITGARVSPRQFKQALVQEGIWTPIYAAMLALEDKAKAGTATDEELQLWLWWSEATEFELGHPVLDAVAATLGLSDYLPTVFARAERL